MGVVGQNVPRKDSGLKVTGAARYVDDLSFPGMLHGRTVRSITACGTLRRVNCDFDATGFTVVDHRDIPGRNMIALIEEDQPCLVEEEIRHHGEAILLLAHEDRERLLEARVELEFEEKAPLLDAGESGKVFKTIHIVKGNVNKGFSDADMVIEGEYRTGHQEQLYIEPNGIIAVPENGGVTIIGSLQCPYYVHRALTVLLALPDDRVRVVAAECGGAFGGKEDYPSMIAGHAALLAVKAERPVKIVYDRHEDMAATTKRHPAVIHHRTGVKRDGRITAMEIDVLMDAGAYVTLSPVVLSRGLLHATGPYRCDNVRVFGRVVMTNTPPNGAFRGFGAPQTLFAVEVHMDRIAEHLGLDPVHVREVNVLRPGDTTATGQVLGEDCSAHKALTEAVRRSGFHEKRAAWKGTSRGIGLSLFFHVAGFTGSGEEMLASKASLKLTEAGVQILVSSTEMGQGSRTALSQIVADALGIPYEDVEMHNPDTRVVPDSGPTVASRTCMVVGEILRRCAEKMKERLGELSPREYFRNYGPFAVTDSYVNPAGITWDEYAYRGDAYATYAWACDVIEVEMDPDTYEVRPLRVTAVHDAGKAVNPGLAAGQVEGGTLQGVGFALGEKVVMEGGRMVNARLTDYAVPTTLDAPDIEAVLLETPFPHGPFGAKGIGEIPMDGPAPAVVNAIRHLGVDIRSVPTSPELILEAICDSIPPIPPHPG